MLYSDKTYGLQIISETVCSVIAVTAGEETNEKSYINAYAEGFLNKAIATDARAAGSFGDVSGEVFSRKNETGYSEEELGSYYSYGTADLDDSGERDHNAMYSIGLLNIESSYNLLARWQLSYTMNQGGGSKGGYLSVGTSSRNLGGTLMYHSWGSASGSGNEIYEINFYMRPVFLLRTDVNVVGGEGTSTSPYRLGS